MNQLATAKSHREAARTIRDRYARMLKNSDRLPPSQMHLDASYWDDQLKRARYHEAEAGKLGRTTK